MKRVSWARCLRLAAWVNARWEEDWIRLRVSSLRLPNLALGRDGERSAVNHFANKN